MHCARDEEGFSPTKFSIPTVQESGTHEFIVKIKDLEFILETKNKETQAKGLGDLH